MGRNYWTEWYCRRCGEVWPKDSLLDVCPRCRAELWCRGGPSTELHDAKVLKAMAYLKQLDEHPQGLP